MGSQFTHDIEPLSNRGKGLEGTMLNYLGKGATGEVRAVWLSGSPLARKTIRFSLDVAHWDAVIAQIRREIKTLGLLHHRHIVRLVECHETLDNSMELLMAPAAEYNLMTVLTDKSNESMLPAGNRDTKLVDQVAGWMACLSSALAYMHSAGVTHGDIKPQNILVSGTQVWLADFGTGEFEAEPCGNLHSESRWATPVYRPREALQSSSRLRQRGMSADMWSFGCVLLEVATWLAGGSVQALRNFTGVEARRQPYHLAFDRIQTWIEVLRRRFESQEHLRDRQYLVEAVLGTLVLEPGSRLRGPEVWALLTRGMCHEKDGCPCSCVRRPVPAFGDRRQKALEPCPSGVTAIKEESHGAVLYTEDIQLTTPLAT
jgi:serine/threonine protein kinase